MVSKETLEQLAKAKLLLAKVDATTMHNADIIIEVVRTRVGKPEALYHVLKWWRDGYPDGPLQEAIGFLNAGIISSDDVDAYVAEAQASVLGD